MNSILSNEVIELPESYGVPGTSQNVQQQDTTPSKPIRRVKSLNDALNTSNYSPYTCPLEAKEFLEKIKPDGSKSPTIDVNWTNQYRPSTAGRKRAKNIPGDPCGVPLGAAKDAKTPAQAWSLFLTRSTWNY